MASHAITYFCNKEAHLAQTVADDRFPMKFKCQACESVVHFDLPNLSFKGKSADTHTLKRCQEVGLSE